MSATLRACFDVNPATGVPPQAGAIFTWDFLADLTGMLSVDVRVVCDDSSTRVRDRTAFQVNN